MADNPVEEAADFIKSVKGDFPTPKYKILDKDNFNEKADGPFAMFGIDSKNGTLLVREPKNYSSTVNVLVSWFGKLYHCQNGRFNKHSDSIHSKSLENGEAYRLQLMKRGIDKSVEIELSEDKLNEEGYWTIDNLTSPFKSLSEGEKRLIAGKNYTSILAMLGGEKLVDKAFGCKHKYHFVPPGIVREL